MKGSKYSHVMKLWDILGSGSFPNSYSVVRLGVPIFPRSSLFHGDPNHPYIPSTGPGGSHHGVAGRAMGVQQYMQKLPEGIMAGRWFGTFFISLILGITIPTD